jgi:uncharacterized repeat protein (TIGR03803 family)
MNKMRIHRLFTFVPPQSRDGGSLEKLSLPAMICIVVLFCAAAVIASPAQNVFFTTLVTFDEANGGFPSAALVQATDGNLYGTTNNGGPGDGGTVFRITPSGTLTTIYDFCSQPNCTDGSQPWAALVQASDGNFYGTTGAGGTNSNDICYQGGCGTVFKVTPTGVLTTLYNFCSQPNCIDGSMPLVGLVQATDGNFYGTTWDGGNGTTSNGGGTVFKITPAGVLTTLYNFCSQPKCADGGYPYAGLVQGRDGNFYGTTWVGGTTGNGTVFKVTPAGSLTVLYSFCIAPRCADGSQPHAGLVQASDGNFYGTTMVGGAYRGGTVFKITPSGTLTTLAALGLAEGGYPQAGLVQGSDGNFYGTASDGGSHGDGTVFVITPVGVSTPLHNFGGADGALPLSGLVQASDGSFYGATSEGGAYDAGTVFRVGVPRSCATCRP